MRTQRITTAALAFTAFLSAPALAQYKAEDVVRAFSEPPAHLGMSRGICIGTESECGVGAKVPASRAATPAFDLLITFEYDSDEITPYAKQNLDQFAAALRDPGLAAKRFVVEGHTDGKGSQEYNLELSQRRAAAVVKYLATQGVSEDHLLARGFGKSKPRTADLLDPTNRRVEARLVQQ